MLTVSFFGESHLKKLEDEDFNKCDDDSTLKNPIQLVMLMLHLPLVGVDFTLFFQWVFCGIAAV